jgi:transcriptional regulator with XRE-family HTH domain
MDKSAIIAARTALGLTQAAFAEKLGVSPGHIGDLERGHRTLSLKLAVKLQELVDPNSEDRPIVAAVVAELTGRAA